MNFTKLMIAVAAFALVIAVWKMTTRVDRSDSVAVATAFTKAIKGCLSSLAKCAMKPAPLGSSC